MKLKFNPFQLITLSFFFSLLMIASCQKENSQTSSEDEQEVTASQVSSEADAEAEVVFNSVFDDAIGVNDEVGIGGTGVFGRLNACPEVTIVRLNPPDAFPVRVILDFGNVGCTGPDGHFRKGKVITTYTGRLLAPGATATTIFEGFYVDSVKVEGTHKITNSSPAIAIVPPPRQFTVDVIDGKLTKPSGNYVHWNSHKVINQIEGLATPNLPIDDIFKIDGNSRGQVKRGNLLVGWESNITESLYKRFNCRWISKGRIRTVRINTPSNTPWVAVLDFGAGTCDNKATLTINGRTIQITLP